MNLVSRVSFLFLSLVFGVAVSTPAISAEVDQRPNEVGFADALQNEQAISDFKALLSGRLQIGIQNIPILGNEDLALV